MEALPWLTTLVTFLPWIAPMTVDQILLRLKGVRATKAGWDALCPAHDDHKPSLGIATAGGGKVLLNCRSHACPPKAICEAIGITLSDLFPDQSIGMQQGPSTCKPVNGIVARRPAASGYDTIEKAIRAYELTHGAHANRWDYHDAAGNVVGIILRWNLENGGKDIRPASLINGKWHHAAMPAPRPLYRRGDVTRADTVWVVEGEKTAEMLRNIEVVATTSAHGAKAAALTDWSPLAGKSVVILPDNDQPGRAYAADVAKLLTQLVPSAKISLLDLPGLPDGGDAVDWMDAKGDAIEPNELRQQMNALAAANATPYSPSGSNELSLLHNPESWPGYTFRAITSAELEDSDFRLQFAIRRILVLGQPGIIGGPSKTLKTSIAIDLAVSLGTGTAFLGSVEASKPRKVLLISGESGGHAIQATARRVCAARGLKLRDANLLWSFVLPALGRAQDLSTLATGIREMAIEVVILDPLYLCLLAGGVEANESSLYQMGPLLANVSRACLDAGATPLLCHHFRQNIDIGKTPGLEHLAFAGCQQFARQWLLVNREQPYEHDGKHSLIFVAGGSAGHGGQWHLDIDEGVMQEDGTGRKWDVKVATDAQARQLRIEDREAQKQAKTKVAERSDEAKLLAALDALDPTGNGVGFRKVRDMAKFSGERASRVLVRLVSDGIVEELDLPYRSGKGVEKTCNGIKRRLVGLTGLTGLTGLMGLDVA